MAISQISRVYYLGALRTVRTEQSDVWTIEPQNETIVIAWVDPTPGRRVWMPTNNIGTAEPYITLLQATYPGVDVKSLSLGGITPWPITPGAPDPPGTINWGP